MQTLLGIIVLLLMVGPVLWVISNFPYGFIVIVIALLLWRSTL